MNTINNTQQWEQALEKDQNILVMFKAKWCADCHFIEPHLEGIQKAFQTQMDFYQVDMDEFEEPFMEYEVMGIPSFIFFHKGKEVNRFVSRDRKTKEEIQDFLNESLEKI